MVRKITVTLIVLLLHIPPLYGQTQKEQQKTPTGYKPLPEAVARAITASSMLYAYDQNDAVKFLEHTDAKKYDLGVPEVAGEKLKKADILRFVGDMESKLEASKTFDQHNGKRIRDNLLKGISEFKASLDIRMLDSENIGCGDNQRPWECIASGMIFFNTTAQDHEVILRQELYERGPVAPVFTGEYLYYATPEQAVETRACLHYLRTSVSSMLGMIDAMKEAERSLTQVNLGWQNYLENGYSQYPWEAYLNSYVTPMLFGEISWYDPPRDQLVFLHPELGVLADTRSRSKADIEEALLIHGIGYVHYFGETRKWFLGASGTISFSDADNGLGIGPSIHFGHTGMNSKIPHISLSLLWHDFDGGGEDPVIGISIDLWRLVDSSLNSGIFKSALK